MNPVSNMTGTLIPCGLPLPIDNIHAVSVSLPDVNDVIGYEEKRSETMSLIRQGYPRFVAHPYVKASLEHIAAVRSISKPLVLISSQTAVEDLRKRLSSLFKKEIELKTVENDGLIAIELPEIKTESGELLAAEILSYIQHTGSLVSSRKAEDYLFRNWPERLQKPYDSEQKVPDIEESMQEIRNVLGDVILSVSGMNAIYTAFRSIEAIQNNRKRWIQLGWLYVDNIRILEKYSENPVQLESVLDLDSLESRLETEGYEIAGVIVEVPTNPLMQVCDIRRLKSLSDRYGFYIIADISVCGQFCIDISDYAHVIVESLTKFASGQGDLMMGSIQIPSKHQQSENLKKLIEQGVEKPFEREVKRLAYEIQNYQYRMKQHCLNAEKLIDFLSDQPRVKKIYHSLSDSWAENYISIRRDPILNGAVFTVEVDQFVQFYNSLSLWKGPSFGTPKTLNMLYMYLAHYELVSSPEGRQYLNRLGIDPGLIRISVGTEPIDDIIKAYRNALKDEATPV